MDDYQSRECYVYDEKEFNNEKQSVPLQYLLQTRVVEMIFFLHFAGRPLIR